MSNNDNFFSKEEVIRRVNELMIQTFELDASEVLPEAKLYEDLGLDSLDAVDMLVHLESSLGIKVAGEKFVNVRTLQDIYDVMFDVIQQNRLASDRGQIQTEIGASTTFDGPNNMDVFK